MTPLKFVSLIVVSGIALMIVLAWIGFQFNPLLGGCNSVFLIITIYLGFQAIREEIKKEQSHGNN